MRRHGRWNKHKHVRRDSSPKRRIARAGCALCSLLGNNDAGLLTLEFGGFWKLATKEFYEAARTRAAVGAQQTHAVEKNQQIENFRVLEDGRTGALRLLFFDFGDKADQRSEEHTSELQSQSNLVCRLLLEKKKKTIQ